MPNLVDNTLLIQKFENLKINWIYRCEEGQDINELKKLFLNVIELLSKTDSFSGLLQESLLKNDALDIVIDESNTLKFGGHWEPDNNIIKINANQSVLEIVRTLVFELYNSLNDGFKTMEWSDYNSAEDYAIANEKLEWNTIKKTTDFIHSFLGNKALAIQFLDKLMKISSLSDLSIIEGKELDEFESDNIINILLKEANDKKELFDNNSFEEYYEKLLPAEHKQYYINGWNKNVFLTKSIDVLKKKTECDNKIFQSKSDLNAYVISFVSEQELLRSKLQSDLVIKKNNYDERSDLLQVQWSDNFASLRSNIFVEARKCFDIKQALITSLLEKASEYDSVHKSIAENQHILERFFSNEGDYSMEGFLSIVEGLLKNYDELKGKLDDLSFEQELGEIKDDLSNNFRNSLDNMNDILQSIKVVSERHEQDQDKLLELFKSETQEIYQNYEKESKILNDQRDQYFEDNSNLFNELGAGFQEEIDNFSNVTGSDIADQDSFGG